MNYMELSKILYKNENEYMTEYKKRFNSPDVVKLNFKINGNQAFFLPDANISSIVFQILRSDRNVSKISWQLPGVAHEQFTKRCLIDEIVLTNKIEGVYSTRREIASILNDLEDTVEEKATRKRFWGLVNQYNKLGVKEYISLKTCEDLRALYDEIVHAEVIEENPKNAPDGKLFRKDSTSIYTATDKEIHRGTYPEDAIIAELEDALAFLNDDNIELLYRVAVFHYLLGYIHPFYDGNGRLGRFIVSSLLSQEFSPLLAYRISTTVIENINLYYNAFKICNNPRNLGDVTPFLIMMLNMINLSTQELEDILRTRYDQLSLYMKSITKLPNGAKERTGKVYLALIQAGLFSEFGISTKELISFVGNTYTTVKKELEMINNHNLIIKTKVGKENYFMINLDELDKTL